MAIALEDVIGEKHPIESQALQHPESPDALMSTNLMRALWLLVMTVTRAVILTVAPRGCVLCCARH